MLPHSAPSCNPHPYNHDRYHHPPGREGEGECTTRCCTENSSRSSSSNTCDDGSRTDAVHGCSHTERRWFTTENNIGTLWLCDGKTGRAVDGAQLGGHDHHPLRPSTASRTSSAFSSLQTPHQSSHLLSTQHGFMAGRLLSEIEEQTEVEEEREDEDDMDEEEDDCPVECATCGQDFYSMQTYVLHDCVPAVLPPDSDHSPPHRGAGPSHEGLGKVTLKDRNVTASEVQDRESLSESQVQHPQTSLLSHGEHFQGKIVYNPDNSAYVIEDDLLGESDPDRLQVARLKEAVVVGRNGVGVGESGVSSSADTAAPQTISSVFVFRPFPARCTAVNGEVSNQSPAQDVPVIYTVTVYNVLDHESHVRHDVSENSSPLPVKSLLMCFICNLTFTSPRCLVQHAEMEHELQVQTEGRTVFVTSRSSAIIQGVGRERTPLLSFLELVHTQTVSCQGTETSPPSFPHSLPSSVSRNVVNISSKDNSTQSNPKLTNSVTSLDNNEPTSSTSIQTSDRWLSLVRTRENDRGHCENCEEAGQPSTELKVFSSVGNSVTRGTSLSSSSVSAAEDDEIHMQQEGAMIESVPTSQDLCLQDNVPKASTAIPSLSSSSLSLSVLPEACDDHPMGRVQRAEGPKRDKILSSSQSMGGHQTMTEFRNSCKPLKPPHCNWHYRYPDTLEKHLKEKHSYGDTRSVFCLTDQPHPALVRAESSLCGSRSFHRSVCQYSTGDLALHLQSDRHRHNVQHLTSNSTSDLTVCSATAMTSTVTTSNCNHHTNNHNHHTDNHNHRTSNYNHRTYNHNTNNHNHIQTRCRVSLGKAYPGVENAQKQPKSKKSWRCEVCDYETPVAQNLRIHEQSEKHANNMRLLLQNGEHLQQHRTLQKGQIVLYGHQNPLFALCSDPNTPGLFSDPNTPGLFSDPNTPGLFSDPNTPGLFSNDKSTSTTSPLRVVAPAVPDMERSVVAPAVPGMERSVVAPAVPDMERSVVAPAVPGMEGSVVAPAVPGMDRSSGGGGETLSTERTDPSTLFQCNICGLYSTDCVESLLQHVTQDRTQQWQAGDLSVTNGSYLCRLCPYRTKLKANLVLHCQTDKHLHKLQLMNHVREGGPASQWRLASLTSSLASHVCCHACNFHTSSLHQLWLHTSQVTHVNNASTFRWLQMAQVRLQSSCTTATSAPTRASPCPRLYCYCCRMCDHKTLTKRDMIRHSLTPQHVRSTQQLTLDPKDVYVAMLVEEGESMLFDRSDREGGPSNVARDHHSPDTAVCEDKHHHVSQSPGHCPTSSTAVIEDKLHHDVSQSPGHCPTSSTAVCEDKLQHDVSSGPSVPSTTADLISTALSTSTTIATTANNHISNGVPGANVGSVTSVHVQEPLNDDEAGENCHPESHHHLYSNSSTVSLTPGSEDIDTSTAASVSLLACPLCQDECQGRAGLEGHLAVVHKVTAEGMHRLLDMAEVPSLVQGTSDGVGVREEGEKSVIAESSGNTDHNPVSMEDAAAPIPASSTVTSSDASVTTSSVSSSVVTSSVSSSAMTSSSAVTSVLDWLELDLERLEEKHELLVEENRVADSRSPDTDQGEELYQCQTCASSFSAFDKMYAHQKELGHLELKQTPRGPGYLCWKKGCNLYFKTTETLQTHFKEIHDRRKEEKEELADTFQCQLCSLAFKTEGSLQSHGLYHRVKTVTHCSVCACGFKSAQGLRSHLQKEHVDLNATELEQLMKTIDISITALISNSRCRQFFMDFLGCELPATSSGSVLMCDLSEEGSAKESAEQTCQEITTSSGERSELVPTNSTAMETEGQGVEAKTSAVTEDKGEDCVKQTVTDQQSQEDLLNSKAMALDNSEDQGRKFNCHPCKMAFTKQSHLLVHQAEDHPQDDVSVSPVIDRYNDPSRPYKCEVCKESFTQKNILLVHFNSVSHLHTANKAANQGTPLPPVSSSPADLPPRTSSCIPSDRTVSSQGSSASKKEHKCDICNTSYSQKSNLEVHYRSVAHQKRVVQLYELAINGQIGLGQQFLGQSDIATEAAQMQLFMEMMQPQQLDAVSSASLMFQGIPGLNSIPVLQGLPSLLPTSSASLFSPTTAALASYASAAAMETELANQMKQLNHLAEKSSKSSKERSAVLKTYTDSLNCKTADIGVMTTKGEDKAMKTEPVEVMDPSKGDPPASSSQASLKSEMSTNTVESSVLSTTKSLDHPTNPVLAASIPVMMARPRGFMGRFKPQLQRNLLENFGFECVMQFNENSQNRKKEKGKEKEMKKEEDEAENKENLDKTTDKCSESVQKGVNEGEEKAAVDLPEINKSCCLQCGREFSSIFVLKTHEEEVHRTMIPTDVVEDFGERFKEDFERKQTKVELQSVASTPSQTVSQTSTSSSVTSTTASTNTEKVIVKPSKEEMPPPPPPPPQPTTPFDVAQMVPMMSMMPLSMNLMSLGIQPSLASVLPATGLDLASSFPLNLGLMDPNLMPTQQQMQQAAAIAQNQKRGRTRINDEQLKILRAHFDINNSPTEAQVNQMSEQSGLPQKVIKHWFRNTLFKERQRNKDSPYNFSNPPSTTIDLEEYEKTGKMPAMLVKMEPCDDEEDTSSMTPDESVELESHQEPLPPSSFLPDFLPKRDLEDRREYESHSNTSTPSNVSSMPSTPTCSAPPTPVPLPVPTATSLLDAHALALAKEAASAPNALAKRANRTRFTDYQVKMLQDYFEQNAYPKDDELDHLSKMLNLSPRVIVVWFQNARQKARKIYENQPTSDSKESSNTSFQRTPCLNHQCKKCGAVFQRYFELIKHQKKSCLSENNNNKPLSGVTDDDSLSSGTSLDDSGQSDSMSVSTSIQKDVAAPSIQSTSFHCDKCNLSFSHVDLWQEHQKNHDLNTSLFSPFSSSSAFGMLQSLARQEDHKAAVSTSPSTSSSAPSPTSTAVTLNTLSPIKRKLESLEEEQGDDQPRDKRLRTTILPEQLDYLYLKYQLDCNPSRKQLEAIAEEVGLKKRVVQVWFQNTRARERKGHYRAHQQLIHKRCPFCRALFRAKSALESHLATKHPEEMAKGEINVDSIPDAAMEPPQPAHTLPGMNSTSQSSSSVTDISKLLNPNSMQSYLSLGSSPNLSLGFPPPLTSDPIQLSMQHLYEDAYKKYIAELSGTAHLSPPAPKVSVVVDPQTSLHADHTKPAEKHVQPPSSTSTFEDTEGPLDLSMSVKPKQEKPPSQKSERSSRQDGPSSYNRGSFKSSFPPQDVKKSSESSHNTHDKPPSHTSLYLHDSISNHDSKSGKRDHSKHNLSLNSSYNISNSSNGPVMPATSFLDKATREFERSHLYSHEDSNSETQSEFNDSQYQTEVNSTPSSPKSSSSNAVAPMQKRYRTQMTSLQVKVMKLLFVDYKTPTMAECELLGREIGLPKRVVQVWFQNARAKEKKSKQTMAKPAGNDLDYPKTPEECLLCHFKYSHKFTVQDHIFTKRHIDNVKGYIQMKLDTERDISDSVGLIQPAHPQDTEQKSWGKSSSSASQKQVSPLQQELNAAALGLSTTLPGLGSSFSLGSIPTVPEVTTSKANNRDTHSNKDKNSKKVSSSSSSSKSSSSKSSSSKDHHQQKQQKLQQQQLQQLEPTAQQAAELAQMMALGGYLPGLDPGYLGYMYSGIPGFFPGLTAMPLLQPGLLPGAEHMLTYDPLSFGTPLPLLQIPPQAIKAVSEKVQDPDCSLAHYTQDCKVLSDLKSAVSAADASCFSESSVDVGYICRKCQMVYPVQEACVTHQRMACYPNTSPATSTMLKLEQLQHKCGVCSDKLSTVSEAKAHCQLESHKAKVKKLGSSVPPPSSSFPSSTTPASSSMSPNPATPSSVRSSSTPHSFASGSPAYSGEKASLTGDKMSVVATSASSIAVSSGNSAVSGASLEVTSQQESMDHTPE